MKLNLRTQLVIMSLCLLIIPRLVIGLVNYKSAKTSLDTIGATNLKNYVRTTIESIRTLQGLVDKGLLTKEQAQEMVKQEMLGQKSPDGKRPIKKTIDLGVNGYPFVLDQQALMLAHPNSEGKNMWDSLDSDGNQIGKALIDAAKSGNGFAYYNYPLPGDPNKSAPKISYVEIDPYWGWVVGAGTYLSDFNKQANSILYSLAITLFLAIAIGVTIVYWTSGAISKPISRIAGQLQKIAEGDLRIDSSALTTKRKDEIGSLISSLSVMVDNLKNLIGRVSESAVSVTVASAEISSSANDIATGSNSQAIAAQTINELFKEFNDAIQSVAQSVDSAARLSEDTRVGVKDGATSVNASIESIRGLNTQMHKLQDQSLKIGTIIDVIYDIADQTNLLALNAAIEAARAGEQGRGFAVVADEVRKLAERSAGASKEISVIIRLMQKNAEDSVHSAAEAVSVCQRTEEIFAYILEKTNATAEQVSEIAAACEEQAAQCNEVLGSIESVAAASQQSAAGAEEASSATQSLTSLAKELERNASVFKT